MLLSIEHDLSDSKFPEARDAMLDPMIESFSLLMSYVILWYK